MTKQDNELFYLVAEEHRFIIIPLVNKIIDTFWNLHTANSKFDKTLNHERSATEKEMVEDDVFQNEEVRKLIDVPNNIKFIHALIDFLLKDYCSFGQKFVGTYCRPSRVIKRYRKQVNKTLKVFF